MFMQLDLFQLVNMLLSKREKKSAFHPAKVTEFVFWIMPKAQSFNFIRKAVEEKKKNSMYSIFHFIGISSNEGELSLPQSEAKSESQ